MRACFLANSANFGDFAEDTSSLQMLLGGFMSFLKIDL
jgi:hypothetical protein